MVDASLILCRRLTLKLLSGTFVELLKASFSLVLFAIAKFNTVCPNEEKYSKNEKVAGSLGKLEGYLKGWITDRKVIGGSMFGGSVKPRYWSAEEEIAVYPICTFAMIIYIYYIGTYFVSIDLALNSSAEIPTRYRSGQWMANCNERTYPNTSEGGEYICLSPSNI